MRYVVQELLRCYLTIEQHFQLHAYDKCISQLREKFKENKSQVTQAIFSHSQVVKKNQVVIMLIDHIWNNEPGLTEDLTKVLTELTALGTSEHSKVALRARQVLIAAHQPSYDSRHNQVESIFLSAVDNYGHNFQPDNLQTLITSETSIFDVLHDFFYHPSNEQIRQAALEVYVRRGHIAYEVNCLKHHKVPNTDICAVEYQFTLPSNHPNRGKNFKKRSILYQPKCQVKVSCSC